MVQAYSTALATDASFRPNLWALRRIYSRKAQWPNVLTLLDTEARHAPTKRERAEVWTEKGHILEDLLKEIDEAVPIHGTAATNELAALILRDSAKVQLHDAERRNRKAVRAGQDPVEPLYTLADAERVIGRFQSVGYREPFAVAPGVRATWTEAGHMLGSGSIRLEVEEGGRTRGIVFSGDLGPRGVPILRDYEPFHHAELVFLESTYGDRDHRPFRETVEEFTGIVRTAAAERGRILVPTFAVGRAQLLTVLLARMFRRGEVQPFPVFLDSPMAIEASRIYARHPELFDDEMTEYLRERPLAEDLRTLRLTATADESRRINDEPGPCLVMAGAGMCNAGRILHHLKHSLWRTGTHVVIVGYQADGSLGRRLIEGEKAVKIFGETIAVRAQVHTLGGFSAHAGQTDLLGWFEAIAPCRPRVVLTHGEDGPRGALATGIEQRHRLRPLLPRLGEVIEI